MASKVSCLCPTYGRVRALEEAVESFLRQDYAGPKELVVFNDLAEQDLVFDHPEVRVVNTKDRVVPLGAKFNETARLATGDVYCVWEDDDIYLPHRLRYSVERLGNGLFHTGKGYYEQSYQKIVRARNLFHANLTLRADIFWSVGGYSQSDWCGIDTMLFEALQAKYGGFTQEIPDGDLFYIYRWSSINDYHASYWANNNSSAMAADHVRGRILRGEIPTGTVRLNPRWSYDYPEFLP